MRRSSAPMAMETSGSGAGAGAGVEPPSNSRGWSEKLSPRKIPANLRIRANFNEKGFETVKHKQLESTACEWKAARVGAHPQAFPANAALAQLVEHIIRNDGVVGSSPPSGTTFSKA